MNDFSKVTYMRLTYIFGAIAAWLMVMNEPVVKMSSIAIALIGGYCLAALLLTFAELLKKYEWVFTILFFVIGIISVLSGIALFFTHPITVFTANAAMVFAFCAVFFNDAIAGKYTNERYKS